MSADEGLDGLGSLDDLVALLAYRMVLENCRYPGFATTGSPLHEMSWPCDANPVRKFSTEVQVRGFMQTIQMKNVGRNKTMKREDGMVWRSRE